MSTGQTIDIKHTILSAIKEKTGITNIRLEITPNAKARVTVESHRLVKDFVNQTDALQWLIHTYNLKHLKNHFTTTVTKGSHKVRELKKRDTIEDAADKIFKKIVRYDYYTSDLYFKIVDDFNKSDLRKRLKDEEVDHVYTLVAQELQRELDETMNHKQFLTYKRYLEQFKERDPRRYA